MNKTGIHNSLHSGTAGILLLMVLMSAPDAAGSDNPDLLSDIRIKNFGQMDGRFYRGGQPKEEDYESLADLGITTVIDLRDDPKSYARAAAEAAGLQYINIPMNDKKRPRDEQIESFLRVVKGASDSKFFVHCAGGRHRTGVIGAVYRYNFYRWDYDRVYREMKDYDYYSRWGHGALKDYVRDYHDRLEGQKLETTSPSIN